MYLLIGTVELCLLFGFDPWVTSLWSLQVLPRVFGKKYSEPGAGWDVYNFSLGCL